MRTALVPNSAWHRKFKAQPAGFLCLCVVEGLSRLAFYLVVGVLFLYASDSEHGGLGLSRTAAGRLYGAFLAVVFFMPAFGGIVVGQVLGYRRAIVAGLAMFGVGLVVCARPAPGTLLAGLAIVCIGNALLKPSLPALLGRLYKDCPERQDDGFSICFVAINLGAAIAFVAAGPIRNELGWPYVFWCAAMAIGLAIVVFLARYRTFTNRNGGMPTSVPSSGLRDLALLLLLPAAAAAAVGYGFAQVFVWRWLDPLDAAIAFGIAPLVIYFVTLPRRVTSEERPRIDALLLMFLAAATFFAILHMHGSSLTVWAEERTDRVVGWAPSSWLQEATPAYFENASPDLPRPDPRVMLLVDDDIAEACHSKILTEEQLQRVILRPGDEIDTVSLGTSDANAEAGSKVRGSAAYSADVYRRADVDHGRPLDGTTPLRRVRFAGRVDGQLVSLIPASQGEIQRVYSRSSGKRLPPGESVRILNPEVYQSWNPIWVVVLTPFALAWFRRRTAGNVPLSSAHKMLYGMMLTAISMLVMTIAAIVYHLDQSRVSGLWLVLAYAVITLGEVFLSPMGMSTVAKLAPERLTGIMMGGWFCAIAIGNVLAGWLSGLQSRMAPWVFFLSVAAVVTIVSLLFWRWLPRLERTMSKET
jgi:dipeptide/tripeptide permease